MRLFSARLRLTHAAFHCATAILVAASAASAASAQERSPGLNDLEAVRDWHLEVVNTVREAQGLSPVTSSPALDGAAQRHAEDMLSHGYFDHTSLDGATLAERVVAAGYGWRRLAENLACQTATVEETVAAWLESPAHRSNLLNPSLREVGLGVAAGRTSRGLEVIWVEVLAQPRPDRARIAAK